MLLLIIYIKLKQIKMERVIKLTICFVLMTTRAGFVEHVVKELEKIDEVKETYPVTGGIDIIVKVEGKDVETIAKTILAKIHKIEGVNRTETHIVVPL